MITCISMHAIQLLSAASIFRIAVHSRQDSYACQIDPTELCISADVGLEKKRAGDMKCYFSFLMYGGMQLFSHARSS